MRILKGISGCLDYLSYGQAEHFCRRFFGWFLFSKLIASMLYWGLPCLSVVDLSDVGQSLHSDSSGTDHSRLLIGWFGLDAYLVA